MVPEWSLEERMLELFSATERAIYFTTLVSVTNTATEKLILIKVNDNSQ